MKSSSASSLTWLITLQGLPSSRRMRSIWPATSCGGGVRAQSQDAILGVWGLGFPRPRYSPKPAAGTQAVPHLVEEVGGPVGRPPLRHETGERHPVQNLGEEFVFGQGALAQERRLNTPEAAGKGLTQRPKTVTPTPTTTQYHTLPVNCRQRRNESKNHRQRFSGEEGTAGTWKNTALKSQPAHFHLFIFPFISGKSR